MPNTNTRAVNVANTKIRPLMDRFGQLYNLCKALAAESGAENWPGLFLPNDATVIADGSDVDGRAQISNADINSAIGIAGTFITYMEQTSNANRNTVMKVAVNPENI